MTEPTATSQTPAEDFESYEDFLACFETDDDPRTARTEDTPNVVGYENEDGSVVYFEV